MSFPTDTDFPFQLGDGANYRGYTNHPLMPDVEYVVGVVGLSGDSSQPAVFAASQTFSECPTLSSSSCV